MLICSKRSTVWFPYMLNMPGLVYHINNITTEEDVYCVVLRYITGSISLLPVHTVGHNIWRLLSGSNLWYPSSCVSGAFSSCLLVIYPMHLNTEQHGMQCKTKKIRQRLPTAEELSTTEEWKHHRVESQYCTRWSQHYCTHVELRLE